MAKEKTIHKGAIFGIQIEIDSTLRNAMTRAPAVAAGILTQVALEWHGNTAKKHFEKSARSKYGYADRGFKYLRRGRKKNKPDLVYTGAMRNEILHRATVVQSRTGAVLKMSARALNFVGAGEKTADRVSVNGHSYPNLKKEVKAITAEEMRQITARTVQLLEKAFTAKAEETYEQYAALGIS